MATDIRTFADVIDRWPTAEELGRDIAQRGGTVRNWRTRGIPAEYWHEIVAAADRRGIADVTLAVLARLAHERRNAAAQAPAEAAA